MANLLDLCEQYFGSRNFYEVLKISTDADDKQVKKAYHKLSLLVHPDRVEESVKDEATEKFKVLGRIHSILSDSDKRKIYDEFGQYDEESEEVVMRNWTDYWKSLFREVTEGIINKYEKSYKGSETEIKDLKRAYMEGKGDMDYIFNCVPFSNCEEEPRYHAVIAKLIEAGEVPEFKAFTEESEKKKLRRKKKWAKEAMEVERLHKMRKTENEENAAVDDLALACQSRNKERADRANHFFDSLIEKYAKKPTKTTKRKPSSGKPVKTTEKRKRKT